MPDPHLLIADRDRAVEACSYNSRGDRNDPEDLRDVIKAYQAAVAKAVKQFGGNVAKYMGDGVLCYFGWPVAHEDDAERASLAGLQIVHATASLATPTGQALSARVGLATGLVVVGDLIGEGPAQENAIVVETPNLAARLQGVAEPGQVVADEDVWAVSSRSLMSGGRFASVYPSSAGPACGF